VAEQNMVAMATGLAASGLIPFVYSIATFATLRPLEFIRNGPVVHGLPVRIIGVGGGMEYANNGPTHFALDDVGVLRTLPGLTIICPNDNRQACAAVEATYEQPGPIYYRLSKSDVAPLRDARPRWDGVGAQVLNQGDGAVAVLALGAHARHLPAIAAHLEASGLRPTLASVAQVAPPPVALIERLAEEHRLLVTIEAHHATGGLGSMVCEVVAERGLGARVARFGPRTWPTGITGTEDRLDRWAGIDAASVAAGIAALVATPAASARGT
jgi:transketolase